MNAGPWIVGVIVIALIIEFWRFILVCAVIVGAVWLMSWCFRRAGELRLEIQQMDAATAARADEQNRQFIAGDPRGMYGLAMPAVNRYAAVVANPLSDTT